jgi:hypothetical protein
MLTDADAAIIAWTRQQILEDDELADMVPDGPWEVDTGAHAAGAAPPAGAAFYAGQPSGFPQAIRPVRPGVITDPVAETFDPPGGPPHTGRYLLAAADPQNFRDGQRSRLVMLETCHRLLAAGGTDAASAGLARWFLRLLASGYQRRAGYDPAWAIPAAGATAMS